MLVTVRLPAILRQDAGGAPELSVSLPDDATLRSLLDSLATTYPRLERRIRDEQGEIRRYVNVFIDGSESRTQGGLAAKLSDRSEVQVLPSVAGG